VLPLLVPSIAMTGGAICTVALALWPLFVTEVAVSVTLPPVGAVAGAV
jgi:hypothetical protein